MKELPKLVALIVGTTSAFAQGVVNFNNNVLPAPPDRTVYMDNLEPQLRERTLSLSSIGAPTTA
jgi:hypothetical protein